jgi:hypothetical protein
VGLIARKTPGVTRWAKWAWRAVGVLPGAGPADWIELRREGDAVEYHAATMNLTLWAAETEAYMVTLADRPPSVWAILRATERSDGIPFDVHVITASPFEAQDYADSGEELVEKIAMPPGLTAWVHEFTQTHHVEDTFVKRRRNKHGSDLAEDGRGDARIKQMTDVYRAPSPARKGAGS